MNISDYLKSEGVTQAEFAAALGESASFVSQIIRGHRPVPAAMAVAIESLTGGKVTRPELRPDDWHLIWPELRERYAALLPRAEAA